MKNRQIKQIADLLFNKGCAKEPGLLNGNMGLVVFFFHYARFTGNKTFEEHAKVLFEKVQEQMAQRMVINYAHGVAGFGAAIEYLEQNGFVEADTGKMFEDLDKRIYRSTIADDLTDVSLNTGLSGIGRYLFFRISGHGANDDHVGTLTNKMLLILVTDTFERLLPSLNDSEQEEVIRFLYFMNQVNIYPAKVKRLLETYSSGSSVNHQEQAQRKIEALCQNRDNDFMELLKICRQRHCEGDSPKQSIDSLYSGLLHFVRNDECIHSYQGIAEQVRNDECGLYGGLAGVGLYLMSQIDKRHETWMNLL